MTIQASSPPAAATPPAAPAATQTQQTVQPTGLTAAIVGIGRIGKWHAAALNAVGIPIEGCADLAPGVARAAAGQFGMAAAYESVDALFARHRPDIVVIATPPPAHLENVRAAAAAGARAINLEKPMATDLATADALIASCAATGTLLVVNHQRRFQKQHQQARAWIAAGRIGRVTDVVCGVNGDLLHDGTHSIDLLRFYLGDPPVARVLAGIDLDGTNAYGRPSSPWPPGTRYGHAVDSSSLAHLTFADGLQAVVEVGYKVRWPVRAYTYAAIRGERGLIEVNTPACTGAASGPSQMVVGGARLTVYGERPQPDPAIGSTVEGGWEIVAGEDEMLPFQGVYVALARCLRDGSDGHPLHARSARADLEIIMAIFESALRQRAIDLPFTRPDSPLDEMVAPLAATAHTAQ